MPDPDLSPPVQNIRRQALAMFEQGLFSEAARIVEDSGLAGENAELAYIEGMALVCAGRPEPAVTAFDRSIAQNPGFADAWCNRGVALKQLGRFEDSIASFKTALARQPAYHDAFYNLATVLRDTGRLDEAVAAFDAALALRADLAATWFYRAIALQGLSRLEPSLASYDAAVRLRPAFVEAWSNRAVVLKDLGRLDEAIASCDEAIAKNPAFPEAWTNRGIALKQSRRREDAVAAFDTALRYRPLYPEALSNRGVVLQDLGRTEAALEDFDRAIALRPDYVEAWSNRGIALQELDRLPEALEAFDRALAHRGDFALAWSNRGIVLQNLGRIDEALASFDRSLGLHPNSVEALFNQGICRLLQGDLERGWEGYAYRWFQPKAEPHRVSGPWPDWTGESLGGRTLVVYSEQGFGDTIQFVRYLAFLRGPDRHLIFVTDARMRRVLGEASDGFDVRSEFGPGETADFKIGLLSLPRLFKTVLGTIPARKSYLSAEPERVSRWRDRIGPRGFRIGICWHGNIQVRRDSRRVPLSAFEPLAGIAGVRLVSLQKNHGLDELAGLPAGMNVEMPGADFDDGPDGFLDSAAMMMTLDLVVSSDTSIVHLAGALGRPVWVALRHVAEWRWLLRGETTPWYPGMRLFRQARDGDWSDVFQAMARTLTSDVLAASRAQAPGNADTED